MQTRLGLPVFQVLKLLGIGIALWFIAAMMLRVMGPMGIYDGWARTLLYFAILPGTVPFLLISFRMAGVAPHDRFLAVAIMLLTATLTDGIVLAWLPWIYSTETALVADAGGTILWGAGIALVIGYVFNTPKQATS